jgi:hypothetical protein
MPGWRVDAAHEMALAEPADRRVARRHLADRRPLVGQEKWAAPSDGRQFAPGLSRRGEEK